MKRQQLLKVKEGRQHCCRACLALENETIKDNAILKIAMKLPKVNASTQGEIN